MSRRKEQAEVGATSPDSFEDLIRAVADVFEFAYEHGYHEHGIDIPAELQRRHVALLAEDAELLARCAVALKS